MCIYTYVYTHLYYIRIYTHAGCTKSADIRLKPFRCPQQVRGRNSHGTLAAQPGGSVGRTHRNQRLQPTGRRSRLLPGYSGQCNDM